MSVAAVLRVPAAYRRAVRLTRHARIRVTARFAQPDALVLARVRAPSMRRATRRIPARVERDRFKEERTRGALESVPIGDDGVDVDVGKSVPGVIPRGRVFASSRGPST